MDPNQSMLILFECEIPGRVIVKKNTKKFYNGRVKYSDKYIRWEQASWWYIDQAIKKFQKNLPIRDNIRAYFEFHFKDHKGEPDTSNCIEGPQDLLQKTEVIIDDKIIYELEAVKVFEKDPKTIIKLLKI